MLSGTVVDTSNTVLPGVTLTLTGPERNAISDKNGTFTFGDLPLGNYEVRAVLAGFSTVIKSVTLAESAKDSTGPVLIGMRPGSSDGQIAGSVRDTASALLAGVTVEITSPDLTEKYRSASTGSDGRYQFAELPDGTFDVTFSAPGFWKQQQKNVVLTNGSTASVDRTMQV